MTRGLLALLLPLIASSCSVRGSAAHPTPAEAPRHFALTGGHVLGHGVADIEVRDTTIVRIGEGAPEDLPRIDIEGRFVCPPVIDSHVHLNYLPVAEDLAHGGVLGAVDLGAPVSFLDSLPTELDVMAAGPMITGNKGYPTRSWGSDGYGLECGDADCGRKAVQQLHDAGARVIKVPFTGAAARDLDDETLTAVIEKAHALGLKVAVHALDDATARRAADAGADLLAHTPVSPLSESTVKAWSDRAVITTLGAFGRREAALKNLAALHEAGATLLYGTDLGNARVRGVDRYELELMRDIGLPEKVIYAAATTSPASYWGFDFALKAGAPASFLVLDGNPTLRSTALVAPEQVWRQGKRLR